jgi:hypothetical protein
MVSSDIAGSFRSLAAFHPYVRFQAINVYSPDEEVDEVPMKAVGGFWLGSYVLDAG